MQLVTVDNDEVAELAEKISDVCDGIAAITILFALSDMLACIADQEGGPNALDMVMHDFNGIISQRHGNAANGKPN